MVRITVEDCLERVPNRFSLVLVSAERAKQLLKGAGPLVPNEADNKEIVQALREIAAGAVKVDESEVLAVDSYKPLHLQTNAGATEEILPPEA